MLAANLTVEEIRDYLNVDSLAYLQLDRLVDAVGAKGAGFCDACLTGTYPVDIPVALTRSSEVVAAAAPPSATDSLFTSAFAPVER